MELVYLWVEDYKNIHNQGFNFSPRFTCDYDEDKNELTIDENDDYIKDFFGKNINVTAIVGKNGSGKSNLLGLVLHPVAKKQFIIFTDNTYFYFSGIDENIFKISIEEMLKVRFKKIVLATTISPLETLTTIYYNNVLSIDYKEKYFPSSIGKYNKDISISNRIYTANHLNIVRGEEKGFLDIYNQLNIAKSQNLQNIINLLQNQTINLPFSIPLSLKIEVKNFSFEDNKFINKFFPNLDMTFSFNSFSDYVRGAILNNFFAYKLSVSYVDKLEIREKIIEAFNQQTIEGFYIEISKIFLKEKLIKEENITAQLNPYIDIFLKANQFLKLIDNLDIQSSQVQSVEIKDIANDFINLYENVVGAGIEFLKFSFFHELSDGEESFLSFFALLNEKKLLKYTDTTITNNIILLIDEGELTLHPDWQKKYIKYIVDFFKNNLPESTVHLVFATHSPFLLSDLPKENIIFLEDGGEVFPFNKKEQTFGANIHTLLSHGFFMEDGLMGEFAKNKLNKIIKYLREDKIPEPTEAWVDSKENLKKTIEAIGETFLRHKVLELYYDKFTDDATKEERKKELEKQKKQIESELSKL